MAIKVHTYRASMCLPVISIRPLRAIKVSLPQQRKIPEEKWGRPTNETPFILLSCCKVLNQDRIYASFSSLGSVHHKYLLPGRHSTAPSAQWLDWCGKERPQHSLKWEGGQESVQWHTSGLSPAPGDGQKRNHFGLNCFKTERKVCH